MRRPLRGTLLVAWLVHALAIVVDISGIGTDFIGARFGFAPALSVTVWLVIAVYGIESRFVPLPGVRRTLALLGGIAVVLAWAFPGELRPQALSRWAPLHWVLGIASYGLFGAAVLHGVMLSRAERQMRERTPAATLAHRRDALLRLERLTFRFVTAGFVVLSAALLLGRGLRAPGAGITRPSSPCSAGVFAGLLAGRHAFGWRGPRATRWPVRRAGLLLLAYVGSRFVIEVLLERSLS